MRKRKQSMHFVLLAFCLVVSTVSPSETFKTLVSFKGTNGAAPVTSLVQGPNGNLYGTTRGGGKNNGGTVFEVTPAGKLTTLYYFCTKANCPDGQFPEGTLLLATDGNFYGTTSAGGANCVSSGGCGTVFKVTPAGQLTTLYNFCAKGGTLCSDGWSPEAPLIEGTNGDFYGTTFYGGNSNNAGTLFQITSTGELTTLYKFCSKAGQNCPDGSNPNGVIQGPNGYLYGSTFGGGGVRSSGVLSGSSSDFCDGDDFYWVHGEDAILLYLFCREYGPAQTLAVLAYYYKGGEEEKANWSDAGSETLTFYSSSSGGGAHLSGTIYSITSAKKVTVVYNFCAKANCADGAYPKAPVLEGTDGNLYGTTYGGDGNSKCPINQGCGTVFQLTTTGALTTLHSFEIADGQYPYAGLVQATNGTFYGATGLGGANGEGTIFSVSMGLGPFVKTVPTAANVGTTVMILGTDLTGASAVTFNGKAAEFKVVSATEITATVPTGATTGTVEVTTPGGTLKSWPFQVL